MYIYKYLAQYIIKMSFAALVPYELVDIGANLTYHSFNKDFDKVLERSRQAGSIIFFIICFYVNF